MKTTEYKLTYRLDQIDEAVKLLMSHMSSCSVFTFTGPLGVGKTTLIRAFLRACGVHDSITSPTFTYVNVYRTTQEQTFYHFDLYRCATSDDFLKHGFDEYMYQPNSWALIEWPEKIASLVSHRCCHVEIGYDSAAVQQRLLKMTFVP